MIINLNTYWVTYDSPYRIVEVIKSTDSGITYTTKDNQTHTVDEINFLAIFKLLNTRDFKYWIHDNGTSYIKINNIENETIYYIERYSDGNRKGHKLSIKEFIFIHNIYDGFDISHLFNIESIGVKHDSNKPRYSLLPVGTINQVVQVLEYGASDKYEVDNWQKIPDARRRFYDAAMRHIDAWWNGEINDLDKDGVKGSQLPHLAHAICCLLFLLWFDNK